MEDDDGRTNMAKTKAELSSATRTGLGVAGLVQVVFAFLAFWDLAHREADEVRGPKAAWIPAILINWIGPASYFLFGIRR
jgi:hypothetical protein